MTIPSGPPVNLDDRESLIRWLIWNDPNGCYTDDECADEGLEPWTLEELWEEYDPAASALNRGGYWSVSRPSHFPHHSSQAPPRLP